MSKEAGYVNWICVLFGVQDKDRETDGQTEKDRQADVTLYTYVHYWTDRKDPVK